VTNILLLPQLSGALTAVTNADLRVAVEFVQAAGTALDITGIVFRSQWRLATDPTQIGLDMSTVNGLLINGGSSGLLSWQVLAAITRLVPPGDYLADMLAIADGAVINLFQVEPLAVTVTRGLTC
jgi:hypothetical protein